MTENKDLKEKLRVMQSEEKSREDREKLEKQIKDLERKRAERSLLWRIYNKLIKFVYDILRLI